MRMKSAWKKKMGAAALTALLLTTMFSSTGVQAETELNWVVGQGQTVTLGNNLADLKLSEDFVFLNGTDTQTFQRESGGVPNGSEIGSVFPIAEDQTWAVMFEYEESGHISDDEKDKIDADALLESYKKGTEESNKERPEEDHMFVDGWETPPAYNEKLKSLTWALRGHDINNEPIINYNIRILTRQGNVSAVLISDPNELGASKKILEDQLLPAFTLKEGQRYEDFDAKTDKKAEYGLTALILGGAGLAVAKKVGLIAGLVLLLRKFWYVIILALGAVWRLMTGKKKNKQNPPTEGAEGPQDGTNGETGLPEGSQDRPANPPGPGQTL